jgi:ankyrin repeat protein
MKHILITTIAAVLLVGCGGPSKPPDISIHDAARTGRIEAVKQHLIAGTDVNAKNNIGASPLDLATLFNQSEIADLLRKHGGKTAKELKAEGK